MKIQSRDKLLKAVKSKFGKDLHGDTLKAELKKRQFFKTEFGPRFLREVLDIPNSLNNPELDDLTPRALEILLGDEYHDG